MPSLKCLLVLLAVAVVSSEDLLYDPDPHYAYSYNVQDPVTGDTKSQQESRDGDVVRGSYSLIEPDGNLRTVEYSADPVSGFNAVVRRGPAGAAPAVVAPKVAPVVAPYVAPVVAPVIAPVAPLSVAAPVVAPGYVNPNYAYNPYNRGAAGYPGYSGYTGYPGYRGYTGYRGYPGYNNYPGYTGYPGYSGYTGYPKA